ncbi:hypothetical protein [Candidatus Methylacidiphilum infernorum]|uniref:hypothetical protein n=1 Tax=Candidatus Methylacidiphilum infernorum TaxID=511746 RepID=UPI001EE58AF3|nr:hypothetical protein [Candidatus Methylacidiphilum infernorum]
MIDTTSFPVYKGASKIVSHLINCKDEELVIYPSALGLGYLGLAGLYRATLCKRQCGDGRIGGSGSDRADWLSEV